MPIHNFTAMIESNGNSNSYDVSVEYVAYVWEVFDYHKLEKWSIMIIEDILDGNTNIDEIKSECINIRAFDKTNNKVIIDTLSRSKC